MVYLLFMTAHLLRSHPQPMGTHISLQAGDMIRKVGSIITGQGHTFQALADLALGIQ